MVVWFIVIFSIMDADITILGGDVCGMAWDLFGYVTAVVLAHFKELGEDEPRRNLGQLPPARRFFPLESSKNVNL